MSSISWDPVTGKLRVDPDPRIGDRRPRWSDIEARIASGEQLPPQSEWVGGTGPTFGGPRFSPPGGLGPPRVPEISPPRVPEEFGGLSPSFDPTPTFVPPEADPVQTAVDQATGGNLAQEIMAYLGGDQAGVYREDYDIDGDGEISLRDSIYQLQVQEGKRNPDGTPVTEADPVQTAVDQATGGYTAQDILSHIGSEGEYREDYDLNKDGAIDVLDSVWQLQVEGGLRDPVTFEPIPQPDPVTTTAPVFPTETEPGMDTVGPAGTTITPPAPVNEYVSPQDQFLADYPDWATNPPTLPSVPPPVNEYVSPQDQFLADYPDWATNPPTLPATPDPIQDAVDTAVGGGTMPSTEDEMLAKQRASDHLGRTQAEISASNAPYVRAQRERMEQEQLKKSIERGSVANIPGFGEVFSIPSVSGTSRYVDASGNSIPRELTSEWGRGMHGELFIPKEYKTQRPSPPGQGYQGGVDYIDYAPGGPPVDSTAGVPDVTFTTDPVQDAVDAATATTQGPKPLPSSYGPADNWGEPGYTAYDSTEQIIDPVTSFVEDPVSPFMDEDPSTDTWTAPVADVLSTAGAGAGGDPTTDFAVVNDPTEPVTGDPYPVGVIDPNFTTPVTGVDPNAPGPDPVYYDEDIETYIPPVNTSDAVGDMTTTTGVGDMPTTNVAGDMTTTTGGFPDILFEGQIYTDADGVSWISVLGEWKEVGPTGGTGTGTGDTGTGGFPANPFETMVHIDANGVTWTFTQGQWVEVTPTGTGTGDTGTGDTGTGDTGTGDTGTGDTGTGDTGTGDTGTGDTGTGQSEIDKLNALIAELRAEQAAQQAKQEAERAAWEAQTAAATGKYTLTGPSIGYNPYVSGQYQSDPYGAAGVPDLGGITTIPVPDAWQPPTLQPWQAPAPPAQALASWLKPMAQQTQPSNTWGR